MQMPSNGLLLASLLCEIPRLDVLLRLLHVSFVVAIRFLVVSLAALLVVWPVVHPQPNGLVPSVVFPAHTLQRIVDIASKRNSSDMH